MTMRNILFGLVCGGLLIGEASVCLAQTGPDPKATIALEGTVDKTYAGAHTVIVKTANGVRHLLHFTDQTVVHGTATAEDAFHGLEEGSQVVVHSLVQGGTETALEVDRIDKDGLHVMKGTVNHIDRPAKTLSIELEDGSRETLHLTDRAAADVGKDIDRATGDATKVIVYYTDESGHRLAHYFKRVS
jgi:hypothetical protein